METRRSWLRDHPALGPAVFGIGCAVAILLVYGAISLVSTPNWPVATGIAVSLGVYGGLLLRTRISRS